MSDAEFGESFTEVPTLSACLVIVTSEEHRKFNHLVLIEARTKRALKAAERSRAICGTHPGRGPWTARAFGSQVRFCQHCNQLASEPDRRVIRRAWAADLLP